jgi:NADPH:quinone reductase-like Zn-dependent oxidoreductase
LDVAGEVVSVGAKVTRVRVGDAVFGETHGTFAEYAALSEARLAHKPEAVSFEQAATLPVAGCTALQGLRDAAQVKPGKRVLINGASGGVGSFAVQIARALGAEVTAVCSARNVARARALGAAQVIDYGVSDFADAEQTYDAIFDLVGWTPLRRCLARLRPHGVYVSSAGRIARVLEAAIASLWPRSRVKLLTTNANPEDLATLASMTERGLITPEIDRYHPLEELPQALRTQGLGHARGKSVVVL